MYFLGYFEEKKFKLYPLQMQVLRILQAVYSFLNYQVL